MAIVELGGYRLLEKLGKGSIGTVYRCRHEATGRVAALRVLAEGIRWNPDLKRQLAIECRSLAGLRHPNISALQDFGEENGIAFTVSEFLEGQSLESIIREKNALPVEAATSLMIQATEGLAYAHKQCIVHLDLRPGNLHLTPGGSLKVCDFGIGRLLLARTSPPAIRWGSRIYLSPEQIEGKKADARSDIFSLGLSFYELLTFIHPFHDENSGRALDHILFRDQIPAIEKYPLYPLSLWSLMDRCLAKDPEERYQTMDELRTAARQLLADITDDSSLMMAEIQSFVPRLREAAAKSDAPTGLRSLLREAERLTSSSSKTDYLSLNSLLSAVSEHSRSIQAVPAQQIGPDLSILARIAFERNEIPPSAENEAGPATLEKPIPEPVEFNPSDIAATDEPGQESNLAVPLPPSPAPDPEPAAEAAPAQPKPSPSEHHPEAKRRRTNGRSMIFVAAAVVLAMIAWMRGGVPEHYAGTGSGSFERVSNWTQGIRPWYTRLQENNKRITVRVLLHQARLLNLEGRYAEGKLFLKRALELDPENAEAKAEWAAISTDSSLMLDTYRRR